MTVYYDPRDWYWSVGGDQTQVYSSAINAFVPVNNANFVAWKLNAGALVSEIDTKPGLGTVLAAAEDEADVLRPVDPDVLDGYQTQHAKVITSRAVNKLLFNHENRIRALEGKVALTPAQFKVALKNLM